MSGQDPDIAVRKAAALLHGRLMENHVDFCMSVRLGQPVLFQLGDTGCSGWKHSAYREVQFSPYIGGVRVFVWRAGSGHTSEAPTGAEAYKLAAELLLG